MLGYYVIFYVGVFLVVVGLFLENIRIRIRGLSIKFFFLLFFCINFNDVV